ncbi:dehydrogenase E1 component subunit alpha/beta [Flocculibacter collagenilyticus]|uniref:dehydrogenase E1 component subunit alpha/beta n=1 Tax=Flocculibacter collagenilyticus TaxID=2744479 RepID=UPI0018F4B4CE|nr:alpha-ketoacid dehydrogenase subunit alpha/beta [Flocculibacter collagenilyticus]
MQDRNKLIKENFIANVTSGDLPPPSRWQPDALGLSASECVDLLETQLMSRLLDLHSRVMQRQGESFYTIGSAGHEGNAAIAKAFKVNDMAFLHYRSGAFFIQRSKQLTGQTPLYDMLLSFAAAADDPISGGRHKVLGSKALFVPPQTSTIASHVPKAVGTALSIPLAKKLQHQGELANDGVVLCSFGDASANHSTAQGAINAAAWAAYQNIRLPIVFICEDNGIGISTPTPRGWIHANFANRAGLTYLSCDGLDILDTYRMAKEAERIARETYRPVFLHVRLVRLLGHAGSDAEVAYRKLSDIEQTEQQDPLLQTASTLLANNILNAAQICEMENTLSERIVRIAKEVVNKKKLESAKAVMRSLIPPPSMLPTPANISTDQRNALFKHERHNVGKPQHMAKLLNWTLHDLMAQYQQIVMCGEDIGKKGGVYHVTSKLVDKFGPTRVINTLLDEQSILGLAIGLAHNKFIPIPEIQFLAYVHNAEDQIRGEAATLPFFSNGQFTNPMVVRIAGLAYQKGFGGHFHNDNSFAVFRDIPGLIIACPSNGKDAVLMLREAVRLAHEEGRVVIFLEPIALYMQRDLHEVNDGQWAFDYPLPNESSPNDAQGITVHGSSQHLTIISYGNGYYLSRKAQTLLLAQGIDCQVIDLRWLAPLDEQGILAAVTGCNNVLVVDECRKTASISEAIFTLFAEHNIHTNLSRVTADDSFIPLGKAAYEVLPKCEQIVNAAQALVARSAPLEQPSSIDLTSSSPNAASNDNEPSAANKNKSFATSSF